MISYYAYPGLKDLSDRRYHYAGRGLKNIKPFHILSKICEFYGQPVEEVCGTCRKREYVWCRQVFFYLSRQYTNLTLTQLGDFLGGKDHTTVIHSERTVKDIMDTQPSVIKELKEIEYMICFSPSIKESTNAD